GQDAVGAAGRYGLIVRADDGVHPPSGGQTAGWLKAMTRVPRNTSSAMATSAPIVRSASVNTPTWGSPPRQPLAPEDHAAAAQLTKESVGGHPSPSSWSAVGPADPFSPRLSSACGAPSPDPDAAHRYRCRHLPAHLHP